MNPTATLDILIIGHDGQVARALRERLAQHRLHAWGRADIDLTQATQVSDRIRQLRPDLIINAAAYTAVDQAENDQAQAFALNGEAPGLLAQVAAELDVPFIHYSTDYVFDGLKSAPYDEDDTPNPLGVYGESKWAGEQAVMAAGGQHLILRTSWVYSKHGRNFFLTMQRLLQEKPELRVVDDQIGAPTSAATIAASTAVLIERWQNDQAGAWGVYHLTAQGETSWFGFTQAIAERLTAQGTSCARLIPIPSSEYPTPARRPLNSRLNCDRLREQWQVTQPDWRQALVDAFN